MSPAFIVYFIKRVNTLPRMGAEIDFVAMNQAAAQALDVPQCWRTGFIRGIPILMVPGAAGGPLFIVKRKDTGNHEEWMEDYELDPDPDLGILAFLNQHRADRRRGRER
jgi:hypothetical protein